MSSQQQAIGMMQGAFFVPKGDLINWVNSLLCLQIGAIQQLGTGAVYCQIVDAMFPGKVPMQKVNWKAKNEWQFINNYKILQQSFAKCKIQKHIEIQKLSKSKYQDNLQFIQWMKRYYDIHNKNEGSTYDAKGARKNAKTDFSFVEYRKPIKKKQLQKLENSSRNRIKSKSPYDKVKPRINNRSVTLDKREQAEKKNEIYIDKFAKIRNVIRKSQQNLQNIDVLMQIKEIVEQIEEDLPREQEQIEPVLQTVQSKPIIEKKKKK